MHASFLLILVRDTAHGNYKTVDNLDRTLSPLTLPLFSAKILGRAVGEPRVG